ncbi:hypothetical protein V494_07966, partial [Pseudogymnoascus sp. VKM F-4513 (FW-928)]
QGRESSAWIRLQGVGDGSATGTALSTVRARLLFNTTSWFSALQVELHFTINGLAGRVMISAMAKAEVPYSQKLGPHPSYIQVAKPFVFEQKIQGQIIATGANPQREDTFRLQGVQWIDDTRRALQLPVRTFDTAVIYYHKFRLVHRDTEYASTDAAAAALFAACKIEDTLKKSREILCAAYNLKTSSPSEHLAPDDSVFDGPSKTIIARPTVPTRQGRSEASIQDDAGPIPDLRAAKGHILSHVLRLPRALLPPPLQARRPARRLRQEQVARPARPRHGRHARPVGAIHAFPEGDEAGEPVHYRAVHQHSHCVEPGGRGSASSALWGVEGGEREGCFEGAEDAEDADYAGKSE